MAANGSDFDYAVVGAGILGLAVARELLLRDPSLRVRVVEREQEIAAHQTSHNSGVVHAGIYYQPGSLKAQLCVSGAQQLYQYCDERGIAYERCGKLIVALDRSQLAGLDELERRGRANGVPGLRRVGTDELRELEPHAAGIEALHSPQTGIVDFAAVARALAGDVRSAGGEIETGIEITSADDPRLRAKRAIFCCGAWSDRTAVASGAPSDPRIVPFRGAYLKLSPQRSSLVKSLIYPVPDPELPFLGVHLTRTIAGEVLVGPTALMAPGRSAYRLREFNFRDLGSTLAWPGTWKLAYRFRRTAVDELRWAVSKRALVREAARYVPGLERSDVLPGPAGIRAQALERDGKLVDDFVFSQTESALHVRNAPSPGATSSLAIASMVVDRARA